MPGGRAEPSHGPVAGGAVPQVQPPLHADGPGPCAGGPRGGGSGGRRRRRVALGTASIGDHLARVALPHARGSERRGRSRMGPGGDRRGASPARCPRVRGGAGARAQDVGPPASHRYAAAARSGRVPRAPAAGGPRPGRDRAGIARAPRAPGRAVRRSPLAALRGRFRGGAHRPALSRGCDAPRAAGGCAIDASCGELRPLRAAVAQPPRGGGRIHAPQADEDPRPDDQRGT